MFKKIVFLSIIVGLIFFSFGDATTRRDEMYEDLDRIERILETLMERLNIEREEFPEKPSTVSKEGIPGGFTFEKNLSQGSRGPEVKYLQIVFNKDTATRVSQSGAGSPGNETEYFGPATHNAAMRFQQKYASEILTPLGLSAPTGFIGNSSRKKLNAILRGDYQIEPSDPPEIPSPPTPTPKPTPEPDPEPTPTPEPDPEPTPTPEPTPVEGDPCQGQRELMDIRDNKTYALVPIGSQCWMQSNINYSLQGSWCYNDDEKNCDIYGRLYSWEMAQDVCPSRWKLPSDADFREMERYLGIDSSNLTNTGWRGTDIGDKLKSQTDWDGNNETRFSALPGGGREARGTFSGVDRGASFWTSTDSGGYAWHRHLLSNYSSINRSLLPKGSAISVRCIRE